VVRGLHKKDGLHHDLDGDHDLRMKDDLHEAHHRGCHRKGGHHVAGDPHS
jgi:hypothetical protein